MSFEEMADSAANPKNLPVEFTFDESLVRTVLKDGEACFVAKDVCDILELDNPSMAVSRLDEDERGVSSVVRQMASVKCSRLTSRGSMD